MATLIRPREEVFLDTSYALALSLRTDRHHLTAVSLSAEIEAKQAQAFTTRAVMLEIGSRLSRERFRAAGVELLLSLEDDPIISIIPISESLYSQALQLFCSRPDKEWSLTDCTSFVVMAERGM